MKILKISLRNINSLGEAVLDFSRPPLAGCGLFAITGDTGSGKSTLLDAITLALYGKAPRLGHSGDEQKPHAHQFMQQGANSCKAEIEFEINGKRYRASWSLGKKRTGSLKQAERELSELPEGDILTNKGDIERKLTELLGGLSYEQFIRSVLLAQGEFALFLRSDVKDRAQILERITNTERYSLISKACHERLRDETARLKDLDGQVAAFKILSDAEFEHLQSQIDQEKQQTQKLKEQLLELDQILRLHRERAQNEAALQQTEQRYRNSQIEYQQRNSDWERLAQYQSAMPLLKPLQDYRHAQQNLRSKIQERQQSVQNLQALSLQLQEHRQAERQAKQRLQSCQQEYQEQEPRWEQGLELVRRIENLNERLQPEEAKLKDCIQKRAQAVQQLHQNRQQLQDAQSELNRIEAFINQHASDSALIDTDFLEKLEADYREAEAKEKERQQAEKQAKNWADKSANQSKEAQELTPQLEQFRQERQRLHFDFEALCQERRIAPQERNLQALTLRIEDLKGQQTRLQALVLQLQDQKQCKSQLSEVDENLVAYQDELYVLHLDLLTLEDQKEDIEARLKQLATEGEQLKQLLHTRQIQLEDYKTRHQLESHRACLRPGDSCPLCFSKEQPFREMGLDLDRVAQQAQKDVDDAKKRLHEHENSLKKAETYRQELNQKQIYTQKTEKNIYQHIEQKRREKETLMERLHAGELDMLRQGYDQDLLQAQPEQLQAQIQGLALRLQELQQIHKTCEQLPLHDKLLENQIQNLETQIERLEQEAAESQKKERELRAAMEELAAEINAGIEACRRRIEQMGLDGKAQKIKNCLAELHGRKNALAEQRRLQVEQNAQIATLAALSLQFDKQLLEAEEQLHSQDEVVRGIKNGKQALEAERNELLGEEDPLNLRKHCTDALQEAQRQAQVADRQLVKTEEQVRLCQAALVKLEVEVSNLQNLQDEEKQRLLDGLAAAGFEGLDIDDFEAQLLPHEQALRWQNERQTLEQQSRLLAAERARLLELQKSIQENPLLARMSQDQALTEHRQCAQALEDRTRSIGGLQAQQAEQLRLRKELEQLRTQHAAQRAQVQRWAELDRLIGSADGKRFGSFAQSITLQGLVRFANLHLNNFLGGRYSLEKRQVEGLDLDILDSTMANHRRPLHTLSGGESFLVSLALALGLSDLAAGQTRIDSLFIDEGFGSLDNETLRTALHALGRLRDQGKTIGIISHLEPVKNAIEVQIHVQKGSNGKSTVLTPQ